MSRQLVAIFCTVLVCAFMVGACGDETTVTVEASKDLRAAVLKDHDTLVVPKPSEDEDGDDYDLKPFLASLHGVAAAKIRMSQSESGVEFDTGDCPDDATETYELEYQVDNKDQTLDIECADSAEDLPDSVIKGLLALADNKIYMYELDDNDGDDDEVAITLGDMLFFLIDSDDLDKTKKLSKQAVRFTGEDEDTESADVGAVLAFGGADVAVTSTDDGGAASGDGYLFVAVHWGEDNGADEAFGLGEDEEDNITKPVSGNNNDDDDDDDNNDDNNNDDDDNDNTPSEVCGEKAAGSSASAGDACACTEGGVTKKGVVAAGKCTLSEAVCGQKPQTGTAGESCTCKVNVADATDVAGVIASGMCVVNNLCGTKTHVATNNAACTCKATAGATQEVPGLVASNVCYDKSDVCGHKAVTGDDGASCTCKATVTAEEEGVGFVDANDVCQVSQLSQGPALAAPFAEAKVKAGSGAVGSLVFTWECNAAAADGMYHLASNAGELDSCDEVSVETTPNLERKLAGVHILRRPVTHGAVWSKAGYVAAASVIKSGDIFTYTLTGVDTGYDYAYALAPAKGENDLSWKDHLSAVTPLEIGPSGTWQVLSCKDKTDHRSKKLFTVDIDNKAINLCPDLTERCGYKVVTADDGTACKCKYRTTSIGFVNGYVLNNVCANKPVFLVTRSTKNSRWPSIGAAFRDSPIGWGKWIVSGLNFNPPYSNSVKNDGWTSTLEHCQKTGNVNDLPSGDLQEDDWCTGTDEEKVTRSATVPFVVGENIRHYARLRIHAKGKSNGDDGYWATPWMMDPNAQSRFWGFTDGEDELYSLHANIKLLYGGKGNDYLSDGTDNLATELTYLIDSFSWDRLGGLEKRLSLTGKTTKIKCEDSSKTLKMVVLNATTFAEASVSKKVTPSTCPVAGTTLDDKCFGVRLTIDSNNTLTALQDTGATSSNSWAPEKHLFFKCE